MRKEVCVISRKYEQLLEECLGSCAKCGGSFQRVTKDETIHVIAWRARMRLYCSPECASPSK
jgi:hypothetical protein